MPLLQVQLGEGLVRRAVITGNVFTGKPQIDNKCSNAVIANNVSDQKQ